MQKLVSTLCEQALSRMREAIGAGRYQVDDRDKNIRTLSKLGIVWRDALDEVLELTKDNYYEGPLVDYQNENSDMYWVFKKVVSEKPIYIKFKIIYEQDGTLYLKSFHIDERP